MIKGTVIIQIIIFQQTTEFKNFRKVFQPRILEYSKKTISSKKGAFSEPGMFAQSFQSRQNKVNLNKTRKPRKLLNLVSANNLFFIQCRDDITIFLIDI